MVNRSRPRSVSSTVAILILLLLLHLVNAERDGVMLTQANYDSLQSIKHGFIDPKGILSSWNDSGAGACSGGWIGIKCARGEVIVIQLPWRGLGGRISEKIGQLSSLRKLSLHDNYLGGMIPISLGFLPNLKGVHLFNNRFSGSIPPSLGSCLLLQTVHLGNNLLTGPIPPSLANSSKIYRVNLSYNGLSGSIPFSLTRSPSLRFLALQYNNLSGSIPNTWGTGTTKTSPYELRLLTLDHNSITGSIPVSLSKMDKLQVVSLSRNQISGVIPSELGTLSQLETLDLSNNLITGNFPTSLCSVHSLVHLDLQGNRLENQVPEAIGGLQNLLVLDLRRNQFRSHIPSALGKISTLTKLDLSQNNFSGDIPVSVADLTHLTFFNVSYNNLSGSVPIPLSQKFNSSSFVGNLQLCGYSISTPCSSPPPSETFSPQISIPSSRRRRGLSTKTILLIAAGILLAILLLLCCILFCCLIRRRAAAKTTGRATARTAATRGDKAIPAGAAAASGGHVEEGGDAGGKLVHFDDGPLVFTADDLLCATAEIMGKSSYGTVYKATFEDGNQVAVKRLREKIAKGHREFEAEVNLLGKIRHPNLSSLRAYYIGPKGEKLLVFDFMPRGSLGAFLHARGPDVPIDWTTRMKIMIGTARGLCYLHTDQNMVHGNLSGGNILLDEQMIPKVSDYGLSRLMTTTANSNVSATAASLGYRAPELSKLKKPSTKTDVYSLGVIMLELLTGKSPSETMNGMDLPQWVASIVKEEWTNEVFDMELMRDASTTGDELLNTLKLALHCVDPSPTARPEVQQVLQQLEEIKPELAPRSGGDDAGGPSTSE